MAKKQQPQALELKLKSVRFLQNKHGIKNLLNMGEELANISPDFLVDLYFEGSRSWPEPPTVDDIEEMTLTELVDALKNLLNGDTAGKSATA